MAPTGDHYAARASDTGFSGAVNSIGGYGASVPLALPTAQGGLPVPLRIVFGGNRVGAAGQGWDVPLSFIRRDTTIAHRRPATNPGVSPQAREQLSLTLDGSRTDLVRNAENTAWLARRNGAQLEIRDVGGGLLEMYDGNGLRYSFSAQGGSAVSRLDNGNLYLLRNIFGPGGSNVHLEYAFGAPALPGGGTGLSIDLLNVSYNPDAKGACAKHRVNLIYDADVATPLAMASFGTTMLARMRKLTAVDVTARNSTSSSDPCGGAMTSLRKYMLAYQADADTGRVQLHNVTMIGQQGTPERNVILPVATFTYGQVTDADGKLSYRLTGSVGIFPKGFSGDAIASTHTFTPPPNPPPDDAEPMAQSLTLRNLVDANGDGRPDLVANGSIALNIPSAIYGKIEFLPIGVPFKEDIGFGGASGAFVEGGTRTSPRQLANGNINVSDRWSQAIDFNGDGRLDFVFAREVLNAWVVYLNTPHPQDPTRIVWVRREIDIRPLLQHLPAGSALDPFSDPSKVYLPLSRSRTVNDKLYTQCWKWTTDQSGTLRWILTIEGYSGPPGNKCRLPQGQLRGRDDFGSIDFAEKTITEWELRDINGDGYPDLVYNASAVGPMEGANPPPALPGAFIGQFVETQKGEINDLTGSTDVMALLNVAGVHLETGSDDVDHVDVNGQPVLILHTGTSAFSAPITLEVGQPLSTARQCGVSRWRADIGSTSGGRTVQVCGFEDVNGDGLTDRLTFTPVSTPTTTILAGVARLGTANPKAPFSGPTIQLPGPIARVEAELVAKDDLGHFKPAACPDQPPPGGSTFPLPSVTYPIQRTTGLRDINGDGIPDYIAADTSSSPATWTVALGTGVGFAPPKLIDSPDGFELSLEHVGCFSDNTTAFTTRGLYDLDGDGLPDLVAVNNGFDVHKLNTSVNALGDTVPNPPTSGRLVKIDNGYGAFTNIAYRSEKEDASTLHLLPYPEVVVASVTVSDAAGTALASPTLYAYGGAQQIFDAAADRWVFPGYRRRVSLQNTSALPPPGILGAEGVAIVTDSYPLAPFAEGLDATARFLRHGKAGRTRDVTTLSGNVGTDPWVLLSADIAHDARRISGTHYDWSARLLPAGLAGSEFCVDMVYPYDYSRSLDYKNNPTHQSFDQCTQRGIVSQTLARSFRGTPGTAVPPTSQTVATETNMAVDDLGRVVRTIQFNDLLDSNDDLCVEIEYAAPTPGSSVRVLNAPAKRTVRSSCVDPLPGDPPVVTLAQESWEYDGLKSTAGDPTARVSKGFVTSHIVTRYDMDTHLALGDIREFDATHDPVGNPLTVTRKRDDGATQTTTAVYDAFRLVPVSATSSATNADGTPLPSQTSTITYDPVTLNVRSATDANGTVSGNTFDGFGRVLLSKITPPGGVEGVLSSMSYNGFAAGSATGRTVSQKVFTDAVPEATVGTAPGRTGTTYLDSLGRAIKSEARLGTDYKNQVLVIGQRTYDPLGRVKFVADPFLSTGSFATAYGTTYTFNADGTPACVIRGNGEQPQTNVAAGSAWPYQTVEASEVYPSCVRRVFENNEQIVQARDAASLLEGSPQAHVTKQETYSAIGRLLQSRTFTAGSGGGQSAVHEAAAFGYDALGHLTSMKRYQDPATPSNPVTTTWHYDSLGRMTKLEEPGVAPQTRTFDSWGAVTEVQWCNDGSAAPCPTQDRRSITRFDARGRMTHREDRTNGAVDPETVNDYAYDKGVNTATPPLTVTNVRGRLATATSPTSRVSFSYDAFGRANARVFTDTAATPNKVYVEKHDIHDDGSEKALHLLLPDNLLPDGTPRNERVDYTYDSAGRTTSVSYSDGITSQDLFTAAGSTPIHDVFGRITTAQYGGAATFNATYAAAGRRLLTSVKVTAGGHAREIAFPVLPGTTAAITPYDPVGRERARREFKDGAGPVALLRSYDALGRLSASDNFHVDTFATQTDRSFTYDALGNLLKQNDDSSFKRPGRVSLTYQPPDRDRICSLAYGTAAPPLACNVTYDGAGNILTQPTRSGTRTLTYFPSGQVKTIVDGATNATFKYDAFGAVQQLNLNTPQADVRADKHFGALIKQRIEGAASVVTRKIAAPGLVATRHGPAGGWTFAFGEGRGTRFVTDHAGAFVQDIDYQPFGEVKNPAGATPRTTNYTSEQWNGGDLLAALGVVQLGARMYDPVIGRFLSRDPLLIPRTAATTNPYSFAANDPVNHADPSGLDWGSARDRSDPMENGGGLADQAGREAFAMCGFDCIGSEVIQIEDRTVGRDLSLPTIPTINGETIPFPLSPSRTWRRLQIDSIRHPIPPEPSWFQRVGELLSLPARAAADFLLSTSGAYDGTCDGNGHCAGGFGHGKMRDQLISDAALAIDVALLAVPLAGEARVIGAGPEILGGLERGRRAVWAASDPATRLYACVAATCARSIRAGRLVTADEVLAKAGVDNVYLFGNRGIGFPEMRHVFGANGKWLRRADPYGVNGAGDYAVAYRQLNGNYHMLYMRIPQRSLLYIEDVNSGAAAHTQHYEDAKVWMGETA